MLENSITAVSSSLIGNVAISLVAATVAGLSAWAFGLPFPLVLAVITGLLDLIPQVGATVAAVILVAVALTVSTEAAIAMLIIQLVYQQVENYIVYPIVYRAGRRALAVHDDRLRAHSQLVAGRGRRDPRRAVRRRHQDRAARGRCAAPRPDGRRARPRPGAGPGVTAGPLSRLEGLGPIGVVVRFGRDWFARFIHVQGFDRAMAIAAYGYSALIPLLIVYASVLPSNRSSRTRSSSASISRARPPTPCARRSPPTTW